MKYLLLLLMFPFLSVSECTKKNKKTAVLEEKTEVKHPVADSIPFCVQNLIDEGKKETPSSAPIQIDEYLYNGKKVFLFRAQCCDLYDMVYDENCKVICAPTGGFSGRGDGKCPAFTKEATLIKTIWKEISK